MCRLIRNVVLLTAGLIAWNASLLQAEPIHDAARKGDVAEVKRLLEQDPKLVNLEERAKSRGVTPLHHAAREGHKAVVELLLASGADIDARGSYGTALELAVFNSHRDVADLLLKRGVRLDIFTASGVGQNGRNRTPPTSRQDPD
jgi:ankyrin repeat protein